MVVNKYSNSWIDDNFVKFIFVDEKKSYDY